MNIVPYFPWIVAHPPVIPKLYYGVISQEQRLLKITEKIAGMEAYLSYLSQLLAQLPAEMRRETQMMIDGVRSQLEREMDSLSKDVQDQLDDIRTWVREQTWSVQTWDVTRGRRTDSVDAMRRIFHDVTTYGATVEQLATSSVYPTVASLATSGWNCRALAVIGATVLQIDDQQQWRATA